MNKDLIKLFGGIIISIAGLISFVYAYFSSWVIQASELTDKQVSNYEILSNIAAVSGFILIGFGIWLVIKSVKDSNRRNMSKGND